jgi:hypothetical protein
LHFPGLPLRRVLDSRARACDIAQTQHLNHEPQTAHNPLLHNWL